MKDLSKEIKAYALKNAIDFGKANPGKILPKLFQHGLKKEDIKKTMPLIAQTTKEINSLSKNQLEQEYQEFKKYVKETEIKDQQLPELPNPSKKMVFRIAPFPSGALHIGNAKTFILNSLYAEKYKAKLLLVMDDTIGSEKKPITPEAYKLIQESLDWLKVKHDKKIIYKSDRLKIYYKYAQELINKDKAYVCECSQEKFKSHKDSKKDCPCRKNSKKQNLDLWKKMQDSQPGKLTLRIKTSMQDPNPAFRDRVLFKISHRPHPKTKTKYKVWPTLEMSWAIDDHLLGITHIIRGSDLVMETKMEKYIWDIFKWKHPETIHSGFVTIEGIGYEIAKSKSQRDVKSGRLTGWDDPRTWSIQSLERRGIKPQAIKQFIEEIGLNKQDITIPIDTLYSINRKLIDPTAERYSFIKNPKQLTIKKAPKVKSIQAPIHPNKKQTRKIQVDKIFISQDDLTKFKNKEVRLLHLYNIKLSKQPEFTSKENKNIPKINWVSNHISTTILLPSGETIKGIAEESVQKIKLKDTIQFERNFFCTLDKKSKNALHFIFAHK